MIDQRTPFFQTEKPLDNRGVPTIDTISFYYLGDMEPEELKAMFQPMIDSGVVWHFPLEYIQHAAMLLHHGICERRVL